MAVSFTGGRNRSTLRKPPKGHKSLTSLSLNIVLDTLKLWYARILNYHAITTYDGHQKMYEVVRR